MPAAQVGAYPRFRGEKRATRYPASVRSGPPLARGPLDLRRLVATKHDATAPIHLKVITYGDWSANVLDVSGSNRVYILFNPDRRGRPDFTGEVRFHDGVLWLRITDRAGDFVRRVRAYHPDPNAVTVTVPRGLPNPRWERMARSGRAIFHHHGTLRRALQRSDPGPRLAQADAWSVGWSVERPTQSFGHLRARAVLLVLDESFARPRYIAQQWTVAFGHAAYQGVHDQQFQVCQTDSAAQNVARLDK
jgi:hypothetical protein